MDTSRAELAEILKKSNLYLSVGRFDAAEKLLKATLADYGPLANVENTLGLTYHKQSKFPLAVEAFNRALCINPDFIEAALNLAVTLCDLSRYDDAQSVFLKINQKVNPKKKLPGLVLGRLANQHVQNAKAYEESDLLAEAVLEYKKSLSLYSDMPDVKMALAKLHVRLGQLEKAKTECEEILKLYSDHYEAHTLLGILHFKLEQKDLAKRHWEKAYQANPKDAASRALVNLSRDWPTEK
jgi:tetratricopeptide (TPR) repeat protein